MPKWPKRVMDKTNGLDDEKLAAAYHESRHAYHVSRSAYAEAMANDPDSRAAYAAAQAVWDSAWAEARKASAQATGGAAMDAARDAAWKAAEGVLRKPHKMF